MRKYDCIILGSGVTGLVAAYELCKKNKKVLILEREKQIGGMLRIQKIGDYFIEEYYHHVFKNDHEFINMVKELGIEDRFDFYNTSSAFLYNNEFMELSKPSDVIFFKLLSFSEKIKFLQLMLKIKFVKESKKYDNVTAKEWIIGNSNIDIFEKMFKPLLISKFGNRSDNISAAWFIERIKTRSGRDSSGEKLGYIDGSFGIFLDILKNNIENRGCEIKLDTKVKDIIIEDNRVKGVMLDNEKIDTDHIISTIPPKELLNIGNGKLPNSFADRLRRLEYQGCMCMLIGLENKLTNFYWTNIISNGTLFGSIIEHTNFQSLSKYGEHIIYLASYPNSDSELWKMEDDMIFEKYVTDLLRLIQFDKKDIKWYKIFKTKEAGLVYKTGTFSDIIGIQSPIKGLLVGGMFNSFPDRNINTSIKKGIECANNVMKNLIKIETV